MESATATATATATTKTTEAQNSVTESAQAIAATEETDVTLRIVLVGICASSSARGVICTDTTNHNQIGRAHV